MSFPPLSMLLWIFGVSTLVIGTASYVVINRPFDNPSPNSGYGSAACPPGQVRRNNICQGQ